MGTYTIGDAAERTGLAPTTLRYWERLGLLGSVPRTPAGYRRFDDQTLERVRFVSRAKQLGCSLEEIGELLALRALDDCSSVQARLRDLARTKLVDARRRAAEMDALAEQLGLVVVRLGADTSEGPCTDDCACSTEMDRAPDLHRTADEASTESCSLDPAARSTRVEDWERALMHVTERTATAHGVRLRFADDVDFGEITALVASEHRCCSFFGFALTVDHRGAALEVSAPAGQHDTLSRLFGRGPDAERRGTRDEP